MPVFEKEILSEGSGKQGFEIRRPNSLSEASGVPADCVLAKSLQKDERRQDGCPYAKTLLGHTECVLGAFRAMFGTYNEQTDFAKNYLRFFKLDGDSVRERFYRLGEASCCFHDIGKATTMFDNAALYGEIQTVRHEYVSAALAAGIFGDGQGCFAGEDRGILVAAIAGHHLRFDPGTHWTLRDPDACVCAVFGRAVREILGFWGKEAHTATDVVPATISFIGEGVADVTWEEMAERIDRAISSLRSGDVGKEWRGLLTAVRTALIAADSAGSGVPRRSDGSVDAVEGWVKQAFLGERFDKNSVYEEVIKPKEKEINGTDQEFTLNPMQRKLRDEGTERMFLTAPCGSGKTLGAWYWIANRAEATLPRRAIFLYPTKGTATEGFRDYVSWASESEAALVHSDAGYELCDLFTNPDDERSSRDYAVDERLFALGYWHKRMFSATADQFLAFLQNDYKSTCLLPVLADSVVVIDEVHSFDGNMFSALLEFLANFDVPVLCMTASLQETRKEKVGEKGLSILESGDGSGSSLRYRLEYGSGEEGWKHMRNTPDMLITETPLPFPKGLDQDVMERLDKGKKEAEAGLKVLWVVNTVARCQAIAEYMQEVQGQKEIRCYHSRFKLEDRKKRHREIIEAFKGEKPVLAVTTQVCEMSLDIDADLLVTEKAPITSLIQRMGRCNRKPEPRPESGEIIVYDPENAAPYTKAEMVRGSAFLRELTHLEGDGRNNISQGNLQELLEKHGDNDPDPEKYVAFTQDIPCASSRGVRFRDISDFTVPAVMEDDVEQYEREGKGLELPVPKKHTTRGPGLPKHLFAARGTYSPEFGWFPPVWREDGNGK